MLSAVDSEELAGASPADIRSRVIKLAGPALMEMLLLTTVQMIDMIMVGRLGAPAIAAVGLTNQPIFFSLAIFVALNVGTMALVARYAGAREPEKASEVARQTLIITSAFGLVVAVLGMIFAEKVMLFMGARPEVLPLGTVFFRIISFSLIFSTISTSASAVLRGCGDTRTPMKVNMLANLLVIAGDYLLIYGKFGFPALGVAGAGWATAAARIVAAALFIFAVVQERPVGGPGGVRINLGGPCRLNLPVIRQIVNIGFPSALEQLILQGGLIVFVRVVAGLGTTTYAAHQIALNVLSLSFTPGQAFGIAATALVGQNLGANRPDWAEQCGYETRRLGTALCSIMGLVFIFFGSYIVRLYTADPEVIRQGAMALKIIGVVQPAQSSQFILAGGLRGAGDTRWPLMATAVGIWGIRLSLAHLLIFGLHLGLEGAWVAIAIDQFSRSLLISYRYRTGRWKEALV